MNKRVRGFGPVQPEIFTIRQLHDIPQFHKSLLIPLRNKRALRIGFSLRAWCYRGPRRYKLLFAETFIDAAKDVLFEGDERRTREWAREMGDIQGELKPVQPAQEEQGDA